MEGEKYYLFPHGGLAYNVSRFPRPGSHFGTYQKSRFEIFVEDVIEVSPHVVDANANPKKYLPCIDKPPSCFYLVGEEYIITEPSDNGYYSVFFNCRPDNSPVGSYKTEYFDIITPFETVEVPVEKIEVEPRIKELPRDQWQQMDLFC